MRKGRNQTTQKPADQPSKSQRKREMLALQELGEALTRLSPRELDGIPMPNALRAAIDETRSLSKRGALRRQRQYIGKLMRSVDVAPIREALAARRVRHQIQARQFHQAELWRDRLVRDGEDALDELLHTYPEADRDQLRRLIRGLRPEGARDNGPPGSNKALFRYLRDLTEA